MYSGVVAAREVDDGHARVSTEVHFLRGCVLSRDLDAGGVPAAPGRASAVRELGGGETALGGALGRMFAWAKAAPDLKSNPTMSQLSEEPSPTENRVAFARQAYNDAVMPYNPGREIFPA